MGTIASANRHSLSYVLEKEHGVTPENPEMISLRHTSCSLNLTRDSFTSEEKRQDRQIADVRTGTNQIGGDIGFEPSYGEFDAFLEACLGGTWTNDELKCGVEERSFTIVRSFNDIGQHTAYKGCFLNTLNLSLQPNAMISATFGVIGLDAETQTKPLSAAPVPSQRNRPYDTYIGQLKEGEKTIAVVTGIELTLDNGIQPQFVLFQRSAPFVSWGKSNVSGTMTAFFENMDLISKFLDETPTSLEFTLGGDDGSYTIILPNIRYTGADNPADADGPISISMPFQAILDDCTGTNMIIQRTPPPAREEAEPCQLEFSATSLARNADGTYAETITVTLSGGNGKAFTGANKSNIPGVNFAGLPDGLTAELIRISDTQAELRLDGEPAAYEPAQLAVSFTARAFNRGYCHCLGDTVSGSEQTVSLTFAEPAGGEEPVDPDNPENPENPDTPDEPVEEPDAMPPALQSSVPANNATDIALDAAIELTFSEDIKAGTGSLSLTDGADDTRALAVADENISGATLAITLEQPLAAATTYTLTVPDSAIADLAGNACANIAAITFTTISE